MAAQLKLSVPAEPRYLKCIRGFVKPVVEARFPEEEASSLILAIDEACANIIKHVETWYLPTGRIRLEIDDSKKRLKISIKNFCRQKDVPKIKPRDLQDVRPGGLGLHFIQEAMDRVAFEPDGDEADRLALVMEKAVPKRKDDESENQE